MTPDHFYRCDEFVIDYCYGKSKLNQFLIGIDLFSERLKFRFHGFRHIKMTDIRLLFKTFGDACQQFTDASHCIRVLRCNGIYALLIVRPDLFNLLRLKIAKVFMREIIVDCLNGVA